MITCHLPIREMKPSSDDKPVMKGSFLLVYEGRRRQDPDEPRKDIRQAYCCRCGRLWNVSQIQKTCPYFCPECDRERKERNCGKEKDNNRKNR